MAIVVGTPLYLDEYTHSHGRLIFTKECIEVQVTSDIPKSFMMNLVYGEPYERYYGDHKSVMVARPLVMPQFIVLPNQSC